MSNELFGEVVKTISLDFAQKTSPVTVFAKQGDNRTRIIHIQPLMNGVPMNIDTSFQYVAKFAAKKPDGHYVYNDSAKINDDGTITVTLTDQTLAAHGNATCCIMLETQSGDVLTSQNFTLIIEFSAGAYKNIVSDDEIDDIFDKVVKLLDEKIPPIKPEDKDKVLTANEDGTAAWKDPKGGISVTEITSPEEITADSPDGLYIQEGGSSGGNGGGGTGTVSWNDLTDKPFGDESVTIEWDGNTEGHIAIDVYGAVTYVKVSDLTPETDELIGGTIVSSDSQDKKTITADNIEDKRPDYAGVTVGVGEQPYIMVNHETGTHIAGDIVLPEKGTYFMMVNGIYPIYLTYGSLKKLDPKYLPDDIGGTTIHYYNSLGEVPADLPEGSFVAVPSEGGVKVIDLTKCAYSDGITFNDRILALLASGGGSFIPAAGNIDNSSFWDDLSTNQEVVFKCDCSALASGLIAYSTLSSVSKLNGVAANAATSLVIAMSDVVQRVTIYFSYTLSGDDKDTIVRLAIEPLTVPGN